MANEIDRLEIAIEAEASKANRALSGMEKRLNKIADSLQKVTSLSSAIDSLGNFDLKGFERVQNEMDAIMSSAKKMSRTNISPGVKDSKLKYAAKSLDEIYDKFKYVGKDINVSDMGLPDLQKKVRSTESSLERMNDTLDKKVAIEGTDRLGKTWYDLVYRIQKATNMLDVYKSRIFEIKAEQLGMNGFTIDRGGDISGSPLEQKMFKVSPESMGYERDAMRMVFGEGADNLKDFNDVMREFGGTAQQAGNAINEFEGSMHEEEIKTYEAQIRKLKQELASLANAGKGQGDSDYDAVAKKIQRVTYAKKQYEKNMKSAVKAEYDSSHATKNSADAYKALKSSLSGVNKFFAGVWTGAKKATKGIQGFASGARSLVKALASPISALGKLKNELLGVQKQSRGRYGLPQMVGMSILFSTVFGMISGIKNAIAEGSNNLVQYSQEYNQSISSIVSALTYLKNAWASAFAPIVNVVAPYLQKFIDMIASALNAVGKFLAALTGKGFVVQAKKVFQDYGASLGKDASDNLEDANKAAKELEKTVMGFDELNILNDPNKGSGSGKDGDGIDLSPSDMFETIPVEGALADFGKRLRDAFLKEDWEGLGEIIADGINKGMQKVYDAISWNNVGPRITKFANAFTRTFNSLVDNINWDLMGRTIGTGINTAVKTANLFIGEGGINFKAIGTGLSKGLRGAISEIPWRELGNLLGNWFMISWKILNGFVADMSRKSDLGMTGWAELGRGLGKALKGVFEKINFETIADTFIKGFNGIFEVLKNFNAEKPFEGLGKKIADAINKVIKGIDPATAGKAISDFITGLLGVFVDIAENTDWAEFGRKIGELLSNIDWKTILGQVFTIIANVLGGLIDGLSQTTEGNVVLFMAGMATAFKGGSVLLAVAGLVAGIKGKFDTLSGLFGKTTANAGTAATGLGTATSTAGSALGVFSGKLSFLNSGIATSTMFTNDFQQAISQMLKMASSSTVGFSALLNSLSLLKDSGQITDEQFNNLYSTLSAAEAKKVPFSDAMAYVRDELNKAGVSSEEFEDKLLKSLDKLGVEAPKKSKIIGAGIGDGTVESLEQSRARVEKATKGLGDGIITVFKNILGIHSPSTVFYSFGVNTVEGYNNGVDNKGSSAIQKIKSLGDSIKKSMDGTLKTLSENTGNTISGIKEKFDQAKDSASTAASNILRAFSNLHIPLPHLSVSFSSLKIGNTSIPIPSFSVNWYAKGGFPANGEMFIANEKGPEMVGKMGNRNTVANNRQITDGIAAAVGPAVYNAVTSALSSSGNGQGGDLYLTLEIGGEKLVKKIVKDYNNMKQSDPAFGFSY